MMTQGFELMLVGMGVVFGFLIIMVAVMNLTALIVKKLGLDKPEQVKEERTQPAGDNQAQVAAVIAAVKAHASKQGHN